jgi:ornithine cyclodeaminase/alanine dehydrogenase-like protein (mu-crystallin family)
MAKVLILSEHEVEQLLTMEACIEVMEDALAALARGEVHNPLRQAIRAPGAAGILGLMPAWRANSGASYYALKEVCVFPGNPKRGLDTHLGAVILHSGDTGEPLAFLNASAITAIRTAAVSAVATKLLARKDAAVLAIIGTGVQGQSHRRAIPLVRPIRETRRSAASARASTPRPRRSRTRRCARSPRCA